VNDIGQEAGAKKEEGKRRYYLSNLDLEASGRPLAGILAKRHLTGLEKRKKKTKKTNHMAQ